MTWSLTTGWTKAGWQADWRAPNECGHQGTALVQAMISLCLSASQLFLSCPRVSLVPGSSLFGNAPPGELCPGRCWAGLVGTKQDGSALAYVLPSSLGYRLVASQDGEQA